MTTSRRELMKLAALSGLGVSAVSGCSRPQSAGETGAAAGGSITQATIAHAEKLLGLGYTPAERAQMLATLEGNLQWIASVRAAELPNEASPAQIFDPKLPRRPVRAQKNTVVLARTPSATPGSDADIAFASVAQQGVWLRTRALTSARLTEIYLDRIAAHGGALECFVTVTAEIARRQAARADEDLAAGRDRGPLMGIPYALKDLADTAGVATTWGAEPYRERIPATDASLVRRLQRAGAVLLGKTACGAIAYGDRWFGGVTRNPWNLREGSSGSSAGSAAATGAGLCSFAIGTETLGSIVSPSERCGVTGLRPTFGRVSRAGFMALCWSLDKVGPICRNVEDNALVLAAINGYDAEDPSTARIGFAYDGRLDLSGMTVGYAPALFEAGDSADRAALEALKATGVTLKEFAWPEMDFSPLLQIVLVESAAAFSELTLSNRDDELAWQEDRAWPNTWRAARFVSAVDYVQIDRLRRRAMVMMAEAFDGYDAVVGPHNGADALLVTNATGHPQLALRAGYAQTPIRTRFDGVAAAAGETFRTPRGISLWANLFQEGPLIALGRALEARLDVAGERPPLFG